MVFKKSLIYIISDNEDGSMGIIVNKPAHKVNLTSLLGENINNTINLKYTLVVLLNWNQSLCYIPMIMKIIKIIFNWIMALYYLVIFRL